MLAVREQVRGWRFYDGFRVDAGAPARASRAGTSTPVLAADGGDLASALQSLREQGRDGDLDAAVDRALPGSRVDVVDRGGLFDLELRQPGMLRPLGAAELSDGTLRYLLWVAALLSPRPPGLLVLNEPETSLHPELLAPLAELVAAAATRTQVLVVSHASGLLAGLGSGRRVELVKDLGETRVRDQEPLDEPPWHWPSR